jgi:DNA-binding GntR family transcriptional regulator
MTTPMYRKIADQLRRQIKSGEFEAGTQLPTEQDLQKMYGASSNTIRDAIKQLTTLGLVETKPGQGTFVTLKTDPFVTTLTGNPTEGRGGGEGASYEGPCGRRATWSARERQNRRHRRPRRAVSARPRPSRRAQLARRPAPGRRTRRQRRRRDGTA